MHVGAETTSTREGTFSGIGDDALIEFMQHYENGEWNVRKNQDVLVSLDDDSLDSELILFMDNLETSLLENDLIVFMETFEADDE
jgi:hypothetical protein